VEAKIVDVPEQNHKVLLEVKELKKYFPITQGFFRKTTGYVARWMM
jgi:ABC-type microcin C transport system duplicated ATPase subunit YejF